MPGARAIVLAFGAGILIGGYFAVWFRWPTFIAIAIGATMTTVLLLFATSLAADPAEADAAWRAAAPDLAERPTGERTGGAARPRRVRGGGAPPARQAAGRAVTPDDGGSPAEAPRRPGSDGAG